MTSTGPETRPGGQPGRAALAAPGTWAPLARPVFQWLSVAMLAGNLAIWMQTVAAQWVLTEDGSSAALVALVQTASACPRSCLRCPLGCWPTWWTVGGCWWGRSSAWRWLPRS